MSEIGSNESLTVMVDNDGVIVARGDIDLAGGPLLDRALEGIGGDQRIVIDVAGVSFIDSSGLRCLLAASRRAAEQSGSVVLRAPSAEVRRLLDITGTASQFVLEEGAA